MAPSRAWTRSCSTSWICLAIQDVVNCYARWADVDDDDVLRSAFHEDAVDNHGPWVGARPSVRLGMPAPWARTPTCTRSRRTTATRSTAMSRTPRATASGSTGRRMRRPSGRAAGATWTASRSATTSGDRGGPPARPRLLLRDRGTVFGTPAQLEYAKGMWDRSGISYERPLQMPTHVMAKSVWLTHGTGALRRQPDHRAGRRCAGPRAGRSRLHLVMNIEHFRLDMPATSTEGVTVGLSPTP